MPTDFFDRASGYVEMDTPQDVFLETVSACDLDCVYCPRVVHKARRGSRLLNDALLDRLFPDLLRAKSVTLNGLGEPLLDRRMPVFIERLASAGVQTRLTTNGTLLSSAGAACLRAGLSVLALSLDGATDPTQVKLRDGTSTEELLRRFRALADLRDAEGLGARLVATTVLSAENLRELLALVERVAAAGADGLMAKNLTFTTVPESRAASFAYGLKADEAIVDKALALAERMDFALSVNVNREGSRRACRPSCPYNPDSTVFVSVEGLVFPCFVEGERWMSDGGDLSDRRILGDLSENTLGEIWTFHRAAAFRDAFARNENAACEDCIVYGEAYEQTSRKRAATS